MTACTRIQTLALTTAILVVGAAWRGPARAQDTATPDAAKTTPALDSVVAIDALYRKELDDIERRRLERLAALAGKQAKDEANQTYESYFRAAIAANLFAEAEPVADRVLQAKETSSKVVMLADVAKIMAQVRRGAYDESLASLTSALGPGAGAALHHALPTTAQLTLLEAYFERLSQGEQFAVARKAFKLVLDRATDPTVKAFVASRLARLDLIGKPAPPIAGTDVDGRPVRLADFHGDVVLIVFWASWCLNCAEEVSRLDAVYAAYRDRGFRILGINLDPLQESVKSADAARPAVRQFLLEYNVRWPNLINGAGDQDYARGYAVSEVPANVLIGRDGIVIHIDLTRSNLEKAVAGAVGR
ncbi:MAG: TlpA disulfide reductase family protein [Isosphaeraceae bacterium]